MALEESFDPESANSFNFLDLNTFKSKFLYGHRSHHFHIGIAFPTLLGAGAKASEFFVVYAKNAKIPPLEIEPLEVQWHGMTLALAGDKTNHGTIDINFWYDDSDLSFKLYETFRKWSDMIVSLKANAQNRRTYPYEYKGMLHDIHWELNDYEIDSYMYNGVWPTSVGEMEQAHESGDIMEYTVTFQYDWAYSYNISQIAHPRQ